MKAAVVIPTLNAVQNAHWEEILQAIDDQNISVCKKILLDSSSNDNTCSVARRYNWQILRLKRNKFNHGTTRNRIVRILHKKGVDTVIFLTQDCLLNSPASLAALTDFLWNNDISGCYGRQQGRKVHSFDSWQRQCCYRPESYIKRAADLEKEGGMACFFSNAFSAWKTADILKSGGFPETDFGEDTLLALQVLKNGGKIGYCAEATAWHEHKTSVIGLFRRGMHIGKFHRRNPELRHLLYRSGKQSAGRKIPLSMVFPLFIKFCGYAAGFLFNVRS